MTHLDPNHNVIIQINNKKMLKGVGLEPTHITVLAPEASALTARPSDLMLLMERLAAKQYIMYIY